MLPAYYYLLGVVSLVAGGLCPACSAWAAKAQIFVDAYVSRDIHSTKGIFILQKREEPKFFPLFGLLDRVSFEWETLELARRL